jgi:hypothetical protein
MNRQVYIKAEQIARMMVKGWSKSKIAVQMGMSYDGLIRITRDPRYLEIEQAVRNQVTGKMDQVLDKRASMSDEIEDAVPDALRVLLDQVRHKHDLRAACEVLDRDPKRQFAKNPNARAGPQADALPPDLAQAAKKADEVMDQVLRTAARTPTKTDTLVN